MWTLAQNTLYNRAVDEKNQLEVERSNEKAIGRGAKYIVPANNTVSLTATIQNQGPLSIHFTTLWLHAFDLNLGWNGFNYAKPSNIDLQPGEQKDISANVTIMGVATGTGYAFSSWLITGRGNIVPLENASEETMIYSNVTGGIGAVMMDFEDFKFFNITKVGADYILNNYPTGGTGYYVKQGGVGVAFQVSFTNLDLSRRPIVLFSPSVMFTIFPVTPTQTRAAFWYLTQVDEITGVISTSFTNVTLPYGVKTRLYFASKTDIVVDGFQPWITSYTMTAPVNFALVGRIGANFYGQNVPFSSLYIVP